MTIKTVIQKNKLDLLSSGRVSTIISCIPIGTGLLLGCLFCFLFENQITEKLITAFVEFATNHSNKSGLEIFSGIVLSIIPYFLIMYFLGTSARGTSAIFLMTFLKALGLSIVTTYIYFTYELKGIEYCLLVFFPGKILLLFSMLLLTENCYVTSKKIQRTVKNKNESKVDLIKYDFRNVFIAVIMLLSCLVEFVLIKAFSTLFVFD